MIQKFAPDDNPEDDKEIHRQARDMTCEPIDTEDDDEFTIQAVKNAVQVLGNKKVPGEDGIPNEVWKCVVTILPKYLTAIYSTMAVLRQESSQTDGRKLRLYP
jgi:hypothetical protein